jgi:hypothetical protein
MIRGLKACMERCVAWDGNCFEVEDMKIHFIKYYVAINLVT